jgi:hypothetical protein
VPSSKTVSPSTTVSRVRRSPRLSRKLAGGALALAAVASSAVIPSMVIPSTGASSAVIPSTVASSTVASSTTLVAFTQPQWLAGPVAARRPTPRQIAWSLLRSQGWWTGEYTYLSRLWVRESGWNPYASNPSSGAYGIPQAVPGGKMASAGRDWRTSPRTQISWGMRYIKVRYGTPYRAWRHELSFGWY